MQKLVAVLTVISMGVLALAQGGQGGLGGGFGGGGGQGGGFGGGGFGGGNAQGPQGGRGQQQYDRSVQNIEAKIATYLTGDEIKNILTPGEYSEWPLTLKAGQVVIAESRSDAFDPALEVVDGKSKVLASNDDRYPGDQRPLLLWHCDQDGSYALRGRCFHDKSGGQFFLRFRIYDSMDLVGDKPVEKSMENNGLSLMRVPMKAGQYRQFYFEMPNNSYQYASVSTVISPTGLPDIGLSAPLASVIPNAVVAPVDGDYYFLVEVRGDPKGKLRAGAREISAIKMSDRGSSPASGSPALWSLSVKAGEFLEASTPDIGFAPLVLAEQPDFSKYDLKKPESNPFYPQTKDKPDEEKPAFLILPARTRDPRFAVILAKRNANIWIARAGTTQGGKQFALRIQDAAKAYSEGDDLKSHLVIGKTDYWTFDAKVGDVMTFGLKASTFSEGLTVMDPDQNVVLAKQASPDENSIASNLIVTKPGRYIASISCFGGGGGGDYSLARKAFQAKEFTKSSPASGEIGAGQVHVWKFTAKPDDPLLMRWKSSAWTYSMNIHDDQGAEQYLPRTSVDANNHYGVLKVEKTTTYLIVLIGSSSKATYSIELLSLPGNKGKG